ncbi:Trimethylamine dehydrogenase [Defluviimonas aquaemixtae]|uniref:Trimethylamine dehydrogenase n=1 Tax=Albidovulum aquaemixtae TaxID=1542388 RepID=A0A2R8BLN9_9RHOB|nr:FAD-dependent oxidoreductase [Defluviimonas aquaemixtae]SPH24263.1 Trimethylamine dehydrogenase [Defluviimonas aquaemixtae]
MTDANTYAVLFEPVRIGPVTARNRFYQVPHCNGMGHVRPRAEAANRGMKAEGGWAVVSTQETEIHPTSDLSPFAENRLWDERDIPALRLMTEAVHAHGALAAIELAHNGNHAQNLFSRAPVFAPSDMSLDYAIPKQARAMDKADIRAFRRWHRDAALRARDAGFDVIYVYAGHRMTLAQHFLLPHMNQRGDEYGGSLENRVRLTRELLEDTREAVGDTCAVAFRFAVDEMLGADGMQAAEEGRAVVELLAELPDLWDVNVCDWPNDSVTTRFQPQDGYQNDYIAFVKAVTSKPVVGVGRLTSPDQMVSMIRKGIVDLIGAARPSIADPFLPRKIEEGRIDEIRECIGCNICVSADTQGVPIRCTQNPTMGEEWRRGWHPEKIAPKGREEAALVIGAGPAGLECAMQLARRGYEVTLAEARAEAGGRVLRESALPGLAAWKRVADYRLNDLAQRANVRLFTESRLDADAVLELGIPNVFVATGATWRRDGIGRTGQRRPPVIDPAARVLTPDDIMDGRTPPDGPVAIYDDDQAYLAGVLAERLAEAGHHVAFVTPASVVSPWTDLTLEQARVQARLIKLGVEIRCTRQMLALGPDRMRTACIYSGREEDIPCASAVLVTERHRDTALYDALRDRGGFRTLELIGDAASPGLIADAVYSGHLAARNFERDPGEIDRDWFRREMVALEP